MESVLANIIANKLMAFVGVHDMGLTGACSGLLSTFFQSITSWWKKDSSLADLHTHWSESQSYFSGITMDYEWGMAILFIIVSFIIYYRLRSKTKQSTRAIATLKITTPLLIKKFSRYMKEHESMYFENVSSFVHYHCETTRTHLFHSAFDEMVPFCDSNLDLEGTYIWKENVVNEEKTDPSRNGGEKKTEQIRTPYLVFELFDDVCSPKSFIQQVTKRYDESNYGTLYQVRVMPNSSRELHNHVTQLYSGPFIERKQRKKTFIDSYFSPNKNKLIPYFEKVHWEPQSFEEFGQNGKCNFLFHGPSGVGKSSFIYRIARYLNRDIVSINLRDYYDRKASMWQIIQDASINGEKGREYILVFEEFDISVELLHQYENSTLHIKNQKEKKNLDDVSDDEKPFSKNFAMAFGRDETKLVVRDLLEIFDGVVPNGANMIIATSNRYEEMLNICPELFRPGRLTPVYFGYLSAKEINEMSLYYFGKELILQELNDDSIALPTSQITEKVKHIFSVTSDKNEAYERFCKFFKDNNIR